MENRIDELLEGYSDFFREGRFDIEPIHEEFKTSEYYSSDNDKRVYDLNESYNSGTSDGKPVFMEETFEEYISKHLNLTTKSFKKNLLNYLKSIDSEIKQNAILFSLLADLQNYKIILASTEDSSCKIVMENIEGSRDFILKIFSPQLGLTSDEKISDRRNSLSTYFRGIEKLEFDLKKKEIATLWKKRSK